MIERLWLLMRRVQGLGIQSIAGDIVLDRSAFDTPEADPAAFDGEGLRLGDDVRRAVQAGDVPGVDQCGKVAGDAARPAADVEQPHAGLQGRQQVAGRVLGGAPPVRAQHALLVTVDVDVVTRGHSAW